jgi:F0F1-type ATP synthase membrane subunit c/vacuolar-type H+-ATPase subunit K
LDPSEHDRRVTALVHTGLLAAVGVYGVALAFFRTEVAPDPPPHPPGASLFALFAALGIAQFAGASIAGRMLLRSARSGIRDRVRLYFLLRAAAAEAIALYGLVLGFLRAPLPQVLALLALGVAALLFCAPGKAAWEEATSRSERPGP